MLTALKTPCDEGVVRGAPDVTPCERARGRYVLAATILGSSMAFIDGTVVNVALPALQSDLGATVAQLQWIVEAYALFLSALVLPGGSLGDRYGRRRVFALGVAFFALTSAGCGLAPDARYLIAARGAQGIGAALLVPGSLAILSATFSENERGRAVGTWSAFTSITAALGPVTGGWLVEHVSWRAVFFINLPLAAVVLLILALRVPESRREESGARLDLLGATLLTVGLGALVYGLIEAGMVGFRQPRVAATLVLGGLALGLFVMAESKVRAPMLPLTLFRARAFSGANLLTFFLYAALGGALFFVPFNLIQVQGYSATAAGAALLPFVLMMFLLSRWSGGLLTRYGPRLPLTVGPLTAALGFVLFAAPSVGGSYWSTVFPAALVLGLGIATAVAPLTTVVLGAVEPRYAGVASGVSNAVARTAGLVAVAVLGLVIVHAFGSGLDRRLAEVQIPREVREALVEERVKLAAARVPEGVDVDLQATIEEAIAQAFVGAYRLVMILAAGMAFLSGAIGAVMMKGPPEK